MKPENNSTEVPSDEQIEAWLNRTEITEWVKKKIEKRCPRWQILMRSLLNVVLTNKMQDCTIEDKDHKVAVGINAETWTLWVGINYGSVSLAPNCPFRLSDLITTK
jgi:hypothetical protein